MSEVLVIEDEHALAAALEAILQGMGHTVRPAPTGRFGLALLSERTQLVILDVGLPDMSGLEVLAQIRRRAQPPPVLIITAHGVLENAMAAQRQGASGYLVKPLDLTVFQETVRTLLQVPRAPGRVAAASREPLKLAGTAPMMQPAFLEIARACSSDRPVLITGPSGSGKSLAARIIHQKSAQSDAPFLSLHCGQASPGQIREAASNGGCVFLKHIEGLSAASCIALEEQLDGRAFGVRWIASSLINLQDRMQEGLFPEALFYALRVHHVVMPQLSARLDDLAALAGYWWARTRPDERWELSREALLLLRAHDWPGNVREFQGVLDSATAASAGPAILPHHLPPQFRPSPEEARGKLAAALAAFAADAVESGRTYDDLLLEVEKMLLNRLLDHFEGKPTHLAQAMQMNRVTLRKRLKS